ncbi:hypothetical protein D3C78_1127310 [compost metagenome]
MGILAVLGCFDRSDHFIQNVQGFNQAFENMSTILHFLQLKLGPMSNNLTLMGDIGIQHCFQAELSRCFVHYSHHIEVVSNLKICLLQKVSQNPGGIRIFFQFYDDSETVTSALIAYFCNPVNLFLKSNILHRSNET